MPRVALSAEKKIEYKAVDFKGWVAKQMKLAGKTQKDVANVLGISQGRVSQMLKVPKNKKEEREVRKDPFTYGQVLTLCEFFSANEEERKKLLIL